MNKYDLLKSLLQEIIDAGQNRTIELDMAGWHCGTACCACGDVAEAREPKHHNLPNAASYFSDQLDNACRDVFRDRSLSNSIWVSDAFDRWDYGEETNLLTNNELEHEHLTTDHHDREILHDYVRLVISKVDERQRIEA